jgi:hypothetical protein
MGVSRHFIWAVFLSCAGCANIDSIDRRTELPGDGHLVVSLPLAGSTQEASDAPVAAQAGEESEAQALLAFPWDQVPRQITERRYRVEALRFKARDESGVDWLGSDEVMADVADSEGFTVSDEIGDIDSGDTHDFLAARSCIVAVVPGEVVLGRSSFCDIDDLGNPAPLRFEIELWEKDYIGIPTGFCVVVPGVLQHWGAHCADDGNGDDFLGGGIVEFSAKELEADLPNVGDQLVETVVLSPCEHGACAGWLLPDYSFTYRVYRVPDGKGFPQLEIAEAMRRTGAGSELEVILAGLRALNAPRPRRIEPQERDGDAVPE